MSSAILQRVELLIRQSRFPEAEQVLQTYLTDYPDDAHAQFYMASVQLHLGNKKSARQLTETLLEREPEAFPILALAVEVEMADQHYDRAEDFAEELTARHPQYAESFVKLSAVKLARRNYDEALDAARLALQLDPENVNALNLKIMVGGLLGNPDTQTTIEEALQVDPQSASTIANHGMQLLRDGKVDEALERLKYALSLDPTNGIARYAMTQALKARFWPYRMFLKYGEFSARLSGRSSWMILIGAYLLYRFLARLARDNEALAPFLMPLVWLIAFLFLLTWILDPLMNLYLLSNPYGRVLLDDDDKKMARYTGASLGVGLLAFALYFASGASQLLMLGIMGVLFMIPLGTFLKPSREKHRRQLSYFTLGVVGVGLTAVLFNIDLLYLLVFLAVFAYQWIINAILIRENARVF